MAGFHPACTDTAIRTVVHMGGGAGDSGGLAVPRRLGTRVVQEHMPSVQVQLTKCIVSFPYFTPDPELRRLEGANWRSKGMDGEPTEGGAE